MDFSLNSFASSSSILVKLFTVTVFDGEQSLIIVDIATYPKFILNISPTDDYNLWLYIIFTHHYRKLFVFLGFIIAQSIILNT